MVGPAVGQETTSERAALLDPVVVVATKSERPLREIAGNVTVVSREDLESSLTTSVGDVFRYVPGIDAAGAGSRFGTEGVIIRGIGGNRVAVELDGAPLNHQFAVGNFSNATRDSIDVGAVQRIEVLHGPASALYGSAALGGVVSMWTPNPGDIAGVAGEPGLQFSQAFRSDDSSTHTLGAGALGDEKLGLLGMAVYRRGDETDAAAAGSDQDQQDYESRTALAKFQAEAPWGHQLSTTFYRESSDVDTEARAVLGTGRFASTTRLEGEDDYDLELFASTYDFGGGRLDRGFLRGYYEEVSINQDTLDVRGAAARPVSIRRNFRYDEELAGLELNLGQDLQWGTALHRFAVGAEWSGSEIKERRDATETDLATGDVSKNLLGESFPLHDFPKTDTDEYGLYLQDEVSLGDTILIAALRWDRYELDPQTDPVFAADNPTVRSQSLSEDELSPKLGVVRRLTPATDVYLQYAHGFRGPSFDDAYLAFDIPIFNIRAVPNPDLRPESSDGLEAGLRWRTGWMNADLNLFFTRYEDFIETKVRLGLDPDSGRLLFQSRNIGEARIYGAEFRSSFALEPLAPNLRLDASAFWARGENDDANEPLNSVGPAQAVIGATWSAPAGWGHATLMSTLTARHSRLDETRGPLFEAPGSAVFDFYLGRRFGEHLLLRGGVENLLDKTWWRWADVRGLGPDDVVVDQLSQPGRSVAMNMQWEF
jgi:hemoglobin/transferrin/lactoferrin receptor protein